jgi:hypothetical protein
MFFFLALFFLRWRRGWCVLSFFLIYFKLAVGPLSNPLGIARVPLLAVNRGVLNLCQSLSRKLYAPRMVMDQTDFRTLRF